MIIWSGLGILIPLIVLLGSMLVFLIATPFLGEQASQQHPQLLFALGLGLSAVATRRLGRHLDARGSRVLLDPETGQPVVLRSNHSLFFIPVRYWAVILAVIAIIMLFAWIVGSLGGDIST